MNDYPTILSLLGAAGMLFGLGLIGTGLLQGAGRKSADLPPPTRAVQPFDWRP